MSFYFRLLRQTSLRGSSIDQVLLRKPNYVYLGSGFTVRKNISTVKNDNLSKL